MIRLYQDTFEGRKRRAIQNVHSLDKADGFKDRNLGTILAALECGLKDPETNAHFDALVMLEDLVKRLGQRTTT